MKRIHQWGPSGWGRSTWGCGGEGLAWWAEWWAGCPAPSSGTRPGTRWRTRPAALAGWGVPGGGTWTRCSDFPSSCSSLVCWEWKDSERSTFWLQPAVGEYVRVCLHCPAKTPKMNGITMYSEGIINQELSLIQKRNWLSGIFPSSQ